MKDQLAKRVHISWCISWYAMGIIVGTALCLVFRDLFSDVLWLIISLSLLSIGIINQTKAFLIVCFVAGLLLGACRGGIAQKDLKEYESLKGTNVTIKAHVSQDTSYGPRGDQRIRLANPVINERKYPGELWISADSDVSIKRGDIVVLNGKLSEGFGSLSASMYRAKIIEVQRLNPGDLAREARDHFVRGIHTSIDEPEASLGIGYVVGQKTALPQDLENKIRIVGLTHVVVASGYNLTILVAFARRLLARFSKYLATLAGGSMIIGFMAVTGLSPSMSRAGLVAGLSLLAWYYGRTIHPFVLLSSAAAATLILKPAYVWGDIGWYLSFAAFVGVVVLAPLLRELLFSKDDKPHAFRQLIFDTMSAQIITMPIILASFGTLQIYALPANLLVLPFVPIAMLLTFIGGLAGLVSPRLGPLFGFPAQLILNYSISVISKIADLPHAQMDVNFNAGMLVLSYSIIIVFIVLLVRKTKYSFRETNSLID